MLPYWMQKVPAFNWSWGQQGRGIWPSAPRNRDLKIRRPSKVTKWDGSDLQMERRGQTGNTLPPLEGRRGGPFGVRH